MSNQSGNVILGTLLGAAIGFAAGVLLAPASGKETRDILADKADDFKETLSDATAKTLASLKEVKETAERALKHESKNVESAARAKANETVSELKS